MPYCIPELAGTPYRPSNGSEGRMFQARFCDHCIREDREAEDYCPIYTAAFVFGEHEEGYPAEWVHNVKGEPSCAAYKARTFDEERRKLFLANGVTADE